MTKVTRADRTTSTWQTISGRPVSQCTPDVASSRPGKCGDTGSMLLSWKNSAFPIRSTRVVTCRFSSNRVDMTGFDRSQDAYSVTVSASAAPRRWWAVRPWTSRSAANGATTSRNPAYQRTIAVPSSPDQPRL